MDQSKQVFNKTINARSNNKNNHTNSPKWFNQECHQRKQEFRNARNRFNKSNSDQNRIAFTKSRTKYNRTRYKAKIRFKRSEGQRLENIAKTKPRKFWKLLKKCYKNQNNNDSINTDDLFNHFNDLFGQNINNGDNNVNDNTEFPNLQDNNLDGPITEEEVRNAVFKQKNNKAPGPDELPAEIIKVSYDYISQYLVSIYNNLFENAEYPESWGLGYIIPIFKGGDSKAAKNYRGITLNNILAKIYSQILLNRLTKWTEMHEKIINCQFGYQKGKNTVDCIFILHSIIAKVLHSGQKLYSVFIDYEKCYDKINRTFLWQKLLSQNVSTKMTKAIKAMYSSVKSAVKHKGEISATIDSKLGVKQGDPSSSLLFMMFVNDIISNINTNLEGIVTIDELKLFLLSYADDQVLFATSPSSLQSMLTDLENYCNTWGLKINVNKTKVLIFEKGGRGTNYDFYLYNEKLEMVNSFKYLGVFFFKNGNWYRTQKSIAEHASKAMYRLFSIFNQYEFKTEQKLKLFDTLVSSVLNYSSEVWGFHDGKDIEQVHTKCLRKILCVNKSTNLAGLYGELGRVPLNVIRKIHIFRYWHKILQSNENSLIKHIYNMLESDANNGNSYNNQNWAYQIKSTLETLGLNYIWTGMHNNNSNINIIKQRLVDQYKQTWYGSINNSRRLSSYCRYKHEFKLELYLDTIHEKRFKIALSRFRLSSHRLEIEQGRYHDIPRNERLCKFCSLNCIESEYHFLLVCPFYKEVRHQYLKPYFCRWPTLNKFDRIMLTENKKEILNLAKYIYFATKVRSNVEN